MARRCGGWCWTGVGLGRLSLYQVQADIDAGRLVPVLEEFNPGARDGAESSAVYLGKAGRLPARVRALLDYPRRGRAWRHSSKFPLIKNLLSSPPPKISSLSNLPILQKSYIFPF